MTVQVTVLRANASRADKACPLCGKVFMTVDEGSRIGFKIHQKHCAKKRERRVS